MNNLKSPETQLRGWKPRPPSPELKANIFGPENKDVAENSFFWGDWLRWSVPVVGCFLLVMASLSSRVSQPGLMLSTNQFVVSEPHQASLAVAIEHSERNNLPRTRLERNFGPRIVFPMHAVAQYTNDLIR